MPLSQTPAEFVGGPIDGKRRILMDEPCHVDVKEIKNGLIVSHQYVRRKINGIGVRLPSGYVPFDWTPNKA